MQTNEVVWKLLRATNAPVIIAILDAHLGGATRSLLVPELVNLVEVDLEELRFRANPPFELSRSAQAYCEQWRSDGYLIRRPIAQARQETYELSHGAALAISFAKRLIKPQRMATQSRLNTIINQINNLALETDANEENRRMLLLEERSRIDEQLRQLDEGTFEILDEHRATEQVFEILGLAQEIPDDFVKVRNDFEIINKSLHAKIINFEDGHTDVLEDIFSGVDQIAQSASGRSFIGFYSFLRDINLTETLQDNIDTILDSSFSESLNIEERRFLRELINTFLEQSREVNATRTTFSRGLKRFVLNQDYQHDRVLKRQLDRALGKSHALLDGFAPQTRLQTSLDLTSVSTASVSRFTLKNPAESRAEAVGGMEVVEAEITTLKQLRELARMTEIDFQELVGNVNHCIRAALSQRQGSITIGAVLQLRPATQGVASIIGLIVLATEQGRQGKGWELVRWQTKTGTWRSANVERYEFFREVEL